jgi:hypothetical protein
MNSVDVLRVLVEKGVRASSATSEDVLAVVRLARSRRTWFVTGASQTSGGLVIEGCEPGCIHSGARRFRVNLDFFEVSARASADELLVEVLVRPTPIGMLEDWSI